MGLIQMRLRAHPGETHSFCLVCQTLYPQKHVCVSLFDGENRLGDVCPHCLSEGPEKAAERALSNGVSLVARLERNRHQSNAWKHAKRLRDQILKVAAMQIDVAHWLGKLNGWAVTLRDLQAAEQKAGTFSLMVNQPGTIAAITSLPSSRSSPRRADKPVIYPDPMSN
jgi:hypothetical protein